MNLDDIKDQLNEKISSLWGELEENSTFNTLRERYQSLSTNAQKGLQVGGALLLLLLMFYIPYSYFSASSANVRDFEANREMIRSLLEASRNSRLAPPLPPAQDVGQLTNRVQMIIGGFRLLPEQMGGVQPLSGNLAGGLASPAITQNGVAVTLNTLNLSQVMEAGQRFQSLGEGTKLLGLDMKASSKEGYFDVIFKIVNFSLNLPSDTEEAPNTGGRRPPPPRPSRGGR